MSRSDDEILDDVMAAIESIHSHLQHGPITVEIVMEAVALRLLEIGEAVEGLNSSLVAKEPDIPGQTSPACATSLFTDFATNPEAVQP